MICWLLLCQKEANKRIKKTYKSFQKDFKQIKIMPPLEDVLQDESYTAQLKPVSLYDLLSRDSKSLDETAISGFIKDKTVLVTGGGGVLALRLLGNVPNIRLKNHSSWS